MFGASSELASVMEFGVKAEKSSVVIARLTSRLLQTCPCKTMHVKPVFTGYVDKACHPRLLQVENNDVIINNDPSTRVLCPCYPSRPPVFTDVQNDTRVYGPWLGAVWTAHVHG